MRLVAVPAYAHANVVFSAKHLAYSGCGSAKRFDLDSDIRKPRWNWVSRFQPTQRVIIPEPERSNSPLALERAELKGLQRQPANLRNECLFGRWRNEVVSVQHALGQGRKGFK